MDYPKYPGKIVSENITREFHGVPKDLIDKILETRDLYFSLFVEAARYDEAHRQGIKREDLPEKDCDFTIICDTKIKKGLQNDI